MKKYDVSSNAKINLGLNVGSKNEKGYHFIDSLMIPIDLSDHMLITIYDEEGCLNISCDNPSVPTDNKNTLYKVYTSFFEKINIQKPKIEIFLEKKIPMQAGLGGGSSNAAFFLKVLNQHHGNILSEVELVALGMSVGSDVSFFLYNKAARVRGVGEIIQPIERETPAYSLLLIKPKNIGIDTKYAYDCFDAQENIDIANIEKIIEAFFSKNIINIQTFAKNNLEQAVLRNHFELQFFKNTLENIFLNKIFLMSGSGSTFFTFIDENEKLWLETRINTFVDEAEYYFCKI